MAYYRSEAIFVLRNLSKRGLQISKDPYLNNIMEPNDIYVEVRKESDLDLLKKAYRYTQTMNMPMCMQVELYPADIGKTKLENVNDLMVLVRESKYLETLALIHTFKKISLKVTNAYYDKNLQHEFLKQIFEMAIKREGNTKIG